MIFFSNCIFNICDFFLLILMRDIYYNFMEQRNFENDEFEETANEFNIICRDDFFS